MPKVTVTFNLPEEQGEYNAHLKAGKMGLAIYEFTNFLRDKTKYGDPEEITNWHEVSDVWWKHLSDEGIDPYED